MVIRVRITKISSFEFELYQEFPNLQDAIEHCWDKILWDKNIVVTKPRVHTYSDNYQEQHDEYDYDLEIIDKWD